MLTYNTNSKTGPVCGGRAGVPKEVLQTLLGHRSIKTTEIYANWVRKEELERWV